MLLLAGCNGGEEEPTAGPEPTTVEPSEPDTATEDEPSAGPEEYPLPERPEAMDHDDLDGAEAAGLYFLELLYYALATGDLGPLDEMSRESCGFCAVIHENIAEVYDAGGWYETEPPGFGNPSTSISTDDRGDYLVQVTIDTAASREYGPTGDLVQEDSGSELQGILLISHTDTGWLVGAFSSDEAKDE